MQLSDLTSGTSIKAGEFGNVQQILLGSIGQLYGKVITSLRLVDLETGRILFASTDYSEPDRFFNDLSSLAFSISEKALNLSRSVERGQIEEAVRKKRYEEAMSLLEIYIRDNSSDESIIELRQRILKPLAE
ncbi:hypothetical protein ES703_116624 [subsurface metagenome]